MASSKELPKALSLAIKILYGVINVLLIIIAVLNLDKPIHSFWPLVCLGFYLLFSVLLVYFCNAILGCSRALGIINIVVIPLAILFYVFVYQCAVTSIDFAQINLWLLLIVMIISSLVMMICTSVYCRYRSEKPQIAYATTCIPLRFDETANCFYVCLISNKAYPESNWMFPGGHIFLDHDFQTISYLNSKRFSDIKTLPPAVALSKAKAEAGLADIELISINANTRDENHNDCYFFLSPDMMYILEINAKAKCAVEMDHKYHLDFTYIGRYTDNGEEKNAGYDRVFVKITPADMSNLSKVLENAIKKHLNNPIKNGGYPNDLFPGTVPDMLNDAIRYYCKHEGIATF